MYNDVSKGSACIKVQVTKSASDKFSKPRYSSTKNTKSDLTIILWGLNNKMIKLIYAKPLAQDLVQWEG